MLKKIDGEYHVSPPMQTRKLTSRAMRKAKLTREEIGRALDQGWVVYRSLKVLPGQVVAWKAGVLYGPITCPDDILVLLVTEKMNG